MSTAKLALTKVQICTHLAAPLSVQLSNLQKRADKLIEPQYMYNMLLQHFVKP